MTAEGFFTLVKTEHGLKHRRARQIVRDVLNERIVHAMPNRSFEGLMQNLPPAHAVQFLQFGFEFGYVGSSPLLHDRSIKTAKLYQMKERPCTLEHRGTLRTRQSASQDRPQF